MIDVINHVFITRALYVNESGDVNPKTIQRQRTPIVIAHRNNPGIPSNTVEDLTQQGEGIIDYETEASLEAENDSGATRSFDALIKLSAAGGYGVIHTKEFKR